MQPQRYRLPRTLLLLTPLIFAPAVVFAKEDVSGKWELTAEGFRGEPVESVLTLAQDGAALSGSYDAGFGEPMTIEEGKFENGEISFKTSRTFGDRSFTSRFALKPEGRKLAGSLTLEGMGDPRTVPVEGYRAPEVDPSGLWKWTSAPRREGAAERSNWVKLEYAKGELTGKYMTEDGQVAISDAKLEGKEVSFAVARGGNWGRGGGNGGGGNRMTTYKGTVDGGSIKGTRTSRRGEEDRVEDWAASPDTAVVDPVGKWSWKSRFGRDGGEVENLVTITRAGDALAGTFSGQDGESPVADVKLEGDVLSFSMSRENARGSFTSVFTGKIDGDALKGSTSTKFGEREMRRRFSAERVVPVGEVVGSWSWESRRGRDGEPVENRVTFTKTDGVVAGTMTRGDTVTPLEGVAVDGGKVTFKVTRAFGDSGNSFTTNYHAQVRGDMLKGGFSMAPRDGTDGGPAWDSFWEAKRAN